MNKKINLNEALTLNDNAKLKLQYYEQSQNEEFFYLTNAKELKHAYKFAQENPDNVMFMKDSDYIETAEFFEHVEIEEIDEQTFKILDDNNAYCENTFDFDTLYDE